jgi:hypothetical protein
MIRLPWTLNAADADRLLGAVAPWVRPGGRLLTSVTVQLHELAFAGGLGFQEWKSLFGADGPLGARGFEPGGAVDARIPFDTVIRYAHRDQAEPIPGLSYGFGDDFSTIAVIGAVWPEHLKPGVAERLQIEPRADQASLCRRLGRATPFGGADRELLTQTIDGLVRGAPARGWERLATEIAAIAASPQTTRNLFKLDQSRAADVLDAADKAMRKALAACGVVPRAISARLRPATRLISGADWEDQRWISVAGEMFSPTVSLLHERKPWVWERVSLIANLLALPQADRSRPILLVSSGPDPVSHLLGYWGFDVTCATPEELMGEADLSEAWNALAANAWVKANGSVRPWTERDPALRFGVVLATMQTLVEQPADRLDTLFSAIAPHLAPGAVLQATFAVMLNDQVLTGAVSLAEWRRLFDQDGPLGSRGFKSAGSADDAIPMDTAIRFAPEGDDATAPGLSWGYGGSFVTVAIVAARWPKTLRPGSTERLSLRSSEAFDPETLVIPYSAKPSDIPKRAV